MNNKTPAVRFSRFSRVTRMSIPFLIMILLVLPGCSTKSVYEARGFDQFHAGNYDEAIKNLEKAYKQAPTHELHIRLFRARLNSYYNHLAKARAYREAKNQGDAVKEYKIALGIFPNNTRLRDEVESYLNPEISKPKVFKSTIIPPVTLKLNSAEKMKLNLKSSPITKIFNMVGKSYGVNFIFDKDFRDFVYSIDIEDIGFYEVLNQLCMVGNAEYRVLDGSSVLVYPNTSFKKRTFSLKGVKIFYLSNSKAEDAKKLLTTVFRDQQIQVQEDSEHNSLIIKATYQALREIERFLFSIDKRKSEVSIDVQILEISKNLTNALGLDYGDATTPLSSITAGVLETTEDSSGNLISSIKTDDLNFRDLGNLNFFLTLPSASLSFLESIDDNKIIARPNLRGVDGEKIEFIVGDEVPVPQTQFAAGAAGGVNNIPVTSYTYKNVGVQVKLTPHIHSNKEVTLEVDMTINSVAGFVDGFPTFGKRELKSIIRLKQGETSIIGGFIRDEMRSGLRGVPGLAKLPIIGKLFGSSGKQVKQTDVVFSITPHIIREQEITEFDRETIWSNTQVSPGGTPNSRRTPRASELRRPRTNTVIISPPTRRVPVNGVAYFTLRLNTKAQLQSLAISGSVSGSKGVIEAVNTNFFGKSKVDVMKNFSGSSFDLGYTFPPEKTRTNVVAQLTIKFLEKGKYTINLSSVSAMSRDRQSVDLTGTVTEVEVY
ncbi:MAG: hypothetical protein GY940_00230 [bacterium]|nr:hypothetical protein [bacterium]